MSLLKYIPMLVLLTVATVPDAVEAACCQLPSGGCSISNDTLPECDLVDGLFLENQVCVASQCVAPSPTRTGTSTRTGTRTRTPTRTRTAPRTRTATRTRTSPRAGSATRTATRTRTGTRTRTPTRTSTATRTATATRTPTSTRTFTTTRTETFTPTETRTPTQTGTATSTGTVTPTGTPTIEGDGTLDFTAKGYYTKVSNTPVLHPGMPSSSYIPLPATLSYAELEQLQKDCIGRINMYRSGELKFTGGSSDPGVPKPLLTNLMGNNVCSANSALGDLYANGGAGGCTGAHTNAFSCPGGNAGQNTCCSRSGTTYLAIRSTLFSCLQSMWDEGIGLPDNATFTQQNGHWYNMRRADVPYAMCGFAFSTSGRVWMNQDFMRSAGTVPLTCSCAGKNIGDPDGCGGTCVGN